MGGLPRKSGQFCNPFDACSRACSSSPVGKDHDWSQIYLYVATKTYARHKGSQVPEDIRVESLNDYQMGELKRLKDWLYRQRVKVRQERARGDRKLERVEAEAQRKAEQPELFEF